MDQIDRKVSERRFLMLNFFALGFGVNALFSFLQE